MRRILLVVGMLAAVLALSLGTTGAQGNSEAAHLCQKGGWKALNEYHDLGFRNTGDCVSFFAKGGELPEPVLGALDLTLSVVDLDESLFGWHDVIQVTITGSQLSPGADVTLTHTYLGGSSESFVQGQVQDDGAFFLQSGHILGYSPCDTYSEFRVTVISNTGETFEDSESAPC